MRDSLCFLKLSSSDWRSICRQTIIEVHGNILLSDLEGRSLNFFWNCIPLVYDMISDLWWLIQNLEGMSSKSILPWTSMMIRRHTLLPLDDHSFKNLEDLSPEELYITKLTLKFMAIYFWMTTFWFSLSSEIWYVVYYIGGIQFQKSWGPWR